MLRRKLCFFLVAYFLLCIQGLAQAPTEISRFLRLPGMEGSTLTCAIRDLSTGETLCAYQESLQITPASVLKLVTTATALELLGSDYRFPTTLAYDGHIADGTLHGNLYIIGSGDPSLGSSHFPQSTDFLEKWVNTIRSAGIRRVEGAVIADERIFDTEGVSPKWVYEDLGSYYGAGSYGISVFDNLYRLSLRTVGGKVRVIGTSPEGAVAKFHNYLRSAPVRTDSCYIIGAPFADERFLYGVIPAGREQYTIKGDLPDPPLFLARYFSGELEKQGISVARPATTYRLLSEKEEVKTDARTTLITTYSPTLARIVYQTNHKSINLFADALLKAIGLRHEARDGEYLSSFRKGIRVLKAFWRAKGLDVEGLHLYDGSGLAPTDRTTARFIADLLAYMATQSSERESFRQSLPRAGMEGSVRNFLKNTSLEGKARLKSGSMSRTRGYAGFVERDGKHYALAIFLNNYDANVSLTTKGLGDLIDTLIP